MRFDELSPRHQAFASKALSDDRIASAFIHLARFEEGLCDPLEALRGVYSAIETLPKHVRLQALDGAVALLIGPQPEREGGRQPHHLYVRLLVARAVEQAYAYNGRLEDAIAATEKTLKQHGFALTRGSIKEIYRNRDGILVRKIPKRPGRKGHSSPTVR